MHNRWFLIICSDMRLDCNYNLYLNGIFIVLLPVYNKWG